MTSTIQRLHDEFIRALGGERPHTIIGQADAVDTDERREHMETVMRIAGNYIAAVCAETNSDLSVNGVDVKAFLGGLSDHVDDSISGPLMRAAEMLREDESEAVS